MKGRKGENAKARERRLDIIEKQGSDRERKEAHRQQRNVTEGIEKKGFEREECERKGKEA